MILVLKPFGPVDREVLENLRRELGMFGDVRLGREAPVPARAYVKKARQFQASLFFPECDGEPGDRILAVTDADLFEETLNFVFGYAEKPGRVAIISTARLKDGGPERLRERAVKEAFHELGHTFGLDHDERRPGCVMRFSSNVEDTDRKSRDFCTACRSVVMDRVRRAGT